MFRPVQPGAKGAPSAHDQTQRAAKIKTTEAMLRVLKVPASEIGTPGSAARLLRQAGLEATLKALNETP